MFIKQQRSDLKLEANFEYRMKLFWVIEGALFVDAGNIWAINKLDTRDGALFEFNDFYKEIAVGAGFGFRLDFNFIVMRIDFGRKLLDPAQTIGERFVQFGSNKLSDNWAWNLGIGYPF